MKQVLEFPEDRSAASTVVMFGSLRFDLATGSLRDDEGATLTLRPQSTEVLRQLAMRPGKVVPRDALQRAVWGATSVTDDSLVQCIADIRRALGDRDRRILQTVPRRGYRLVATPGPMPKASRGARRRFPVRAMLLAIMMGACLAGLTAGFGPRAAQVPRIAVLPFDDISGSPRWERLGRGISVDVSRHLAQQPWIGVIGSETAYALKTDDPVDAARALGVSYVLDGRIEPIGDQLEISAELVDVDSRELIWGERWVRDPGDYAEIRDDIVARTNSSLVAAFWFGALNRAVAERAGEKPDYSLSAYEEYLLGIENILWRQPDYAVALQHFRNAVALEPKYARAWMMIGTMQQWIGDVSPDPARATLHARSLDAFRRAYAYEPNDPMVRVTMSIVHLAEGDVDAARRAVEGAVALAPNAPDVLAVAAWQSIAVGMSGPEPLQWARRAIDLNPKGPPWHQLGLGMAAFLADDYAASVAAMRNAPPHHKKFLFLAAAHAHLGQDDLARAAADDLKAAFPDYAFSGDYAGISNVAIDDLRTGAERAGIDVD